MQWPWVAAGANGNVSVVWYQGNQVTDPDCDSANIVCQAQVPATTCPTSWSIAEATITGATSGSPAIQTVNAVQNFDGAHPNGAIHIGKICEGGTTCAATGEDRRLGDYFTNALDQNGCVMIASGDTQQNNPVTGLPLPNSLPLFISQVSGPSLTTGADCAAQVNVPEAGTLVGLVAAGTAGAFLVTLARRRRRGAAAA